MRLLEEVQLVGGPATFRTDRKRQRSDVVLGAEDVAQGGFVLGFGEDDSQAPRMAGFLRKARALLANSREPVPSLRDSG